MSSAKPSIPEPMSTLIRLSPLHLGEIPPHPDLPQPDTLSAATGNDPSQQSSETPPQDQPSFLPFLLNLLDDGRAFLSTDNYNRNFKQHSSKSAPPAESVVNVRSYSIPASRLEDEVPWFSSTVGPRASVDDGSGGVKVRRRKPRNLAPEHWFSRCSLHADISSKAALNAVTAPHEHQVDTVNGKTHDKNSNERVKDNGHGNSGTASWAEFVYGLRDNHSENEKRFTPSIYDARKVVDWDGVIRKVDEEGSLTRRKGNGQLGYRNVTMAIYEMCHAVPGGPVLSPRCFAVLVATASIIPPSRSAASSSTPSENWAPGEKRFIAVTVPVTLPHSLKSAFYSSGRNMRKGETAQEKKEVVLGLYTAVETVKLIPSNSTNPDPSHKSHLNEIEWIMATASDAKGNLPMWLQKPSLPGAVSKDVSYFMKWIKTVDDKEIDKVDTG